MIKSVTDIDFASEVLQSSSPVLVDFWADWCQPCRMLAPVLDKVALELSDKVKFVKMNVDGQETPVSYKVRGIPTLCIFINGELKASVSGTLSESELVSFINDSINDD